MADSLTNWWVGSGCINHLLFTIIKLLSFHQLSSIPIGFVPCVVLANGIYTLSHSVDQYTKIHFLNIRMPLELKVRFFLKKKWASSQHTPLKFQYIHPIHINNTTGRRLDLRNQSKINGTVGYRKFCILLLIKWKNNTCKYIYSLIFLYSLISTSASYFVQNTILFVTCK